jgi:hypothetical protein
MSMWKLTLIAISGLLMAAVSVPAFAANPNSGVSQNAPGQQFRTNGPTNGKPGAAGYAPGHSR